MPTLGVGNLLVNDLLTDVSYLLFEGVVNTSFPGNVSAGVQTVAAFDPSMYVGSYILAGTFGSTLEVVLITAVTSVSFTANFANAHTAGEPIIGSTFPVQSSAGDPFFTQEEMLGYVSNAVNEFLIRCPLVYAVTDAISMPPTEQFTSLPTDCMMPVRVTAFGIGLRETSQANLDGVDWRWQQETGNPPQVYYRDKIGLNQVGVWPIQSNQVPLAIVYQQRSSQSLGLADGFVIPDPFIPTIKAKVLSFCYSKNGEQSSPALARFWDAQYESGVRIANVLLDVINDPNMQ